MPRGIPPLPTVWDFIKLALDQHNANRIRIQREQARRAPNPFDGDTGIAAMHRMAEQERRRRENRELDRRRSGIGDFAEDLSSLFTPPVPVAVPGGTRTKETLQESSDGPGAFVTAARANNHSDSEICSDPLWKRTRDTP
jgi:hypothetical protein